MNDFFLKKKKKKKKWNYCSYNAAWHCSYCVKLKQKGKKNKIKKRTHETTVVAIVPHSEIYWMHNTKAL